MANQLSKATRSEVANHYSQASSDSRSTLTVAGESPIWEIAPTAVSHSARIDRVSTLYDHKTLYDHNNESLLAKLKSLANSASVESAALGEIQQVSADITQNQQISASIKQRFQPYIEQASGVERAERISLVQQIIEKAELLDGEMVINQSVAIRGFENLTQLPEGLRFERDLTIEACPQLETLPHSMKELKSLTMVNCKQFSIPQQGLLLQKFQFKDCDLANFGAEMTESGMKIYGDGVQGHRSSFTDEEHECASQLASLSGVDDQAMRVADQSMKVAFDGGNRLAAEDNNSQRAFKAGADSEETAEVELTSRLRSGPPKKRQKLLADRAANLAQAREAIRIADSEPDQAPQPFATLAPFEVQQPPAETLVLHRAAESSNSLGISSLGGAESVDFAGANSIEASAEGSLPREFGEEGLFPFRSIDGPDKAHEEYRQQNSIEVVSLGFMPFTGNTESRRHLHAYLNGSDQHRKSYKEDRMVCRRIDSSDLAGLKESNKIHENAMGIFAAVDMPRDTFLGFCTGYPVSSHPERERLQERLGSEVDINKQGWELKAVEQMEDEPPFFIVMESDDDKSGCMLSHMKTALTYEDGWHKSDEERVNVHALGVETNLALDRNLRIDGIGLFTARDVVAGEPLFVSHGDNYAVDFSQVPAIRKGYHYKPEADARYPVRFFNSAEETVEKIKMTPNGVHCLSDGEDGALEEYNPLEMVFGRTAKNINQQIEKSLSLKSGARLKYFRESFTVNEDKTVSTNRVFKKGEVLGINSGIIYHKGDEKQLAKLLGEDPARLDIHSWVLSGDLCVTAQGVGNLLDMVTISEGMPVEVLFATVNRGKGKAGDKSLEPQCVVLIAKEDIPAKTNLSKV